MSAEIERYYFDLEARLRAVGDIKPPHGVDAIRCLRIYACILSADIASRCNWDANKLATMAGIFSRYFDVAVAACMRRMVNGPREVTAEEERARLNG